MAYDGTPGSTLIQADPPATQQTAALPVDQSTPAPTAQQTAPAPAQSQPAPTPAATTGSGYAHIDPGEAPFRATGTQGGPPSQALPVAQSEPTPQINKPPFDPRPYAWVDTHEPQLKGTIDDAAQANGIDPARLAWHLNKESGFQQNDANGQPIRGKSGEIGMGQLMPGTARDLSENGRLDPYDTRDNIYMAAKYIAQQDAKFGQNSPSSFAAYNGGPNGVGHPHAQEYAASAFPGSNLSSRDFLGGGSMSPNGLIKAGTQGGPDGFLRYVVDTAPAGMPMTDAWRHAESLLVSAFVEKGDMTGAQHAVDWVAQMSHVGSNQYLMAAHQALSMGDGVGAAQLMAKAHAFFPDGTIGRFRSDGKQVYAERLDENDPTRRIGSPFMVTPNDIAGLLNQTSDPNKFLQTLNAQQKSAADTRLADQHGEYYAGLNPERERAAQLRAQAQIEAANTHAQATTDAAQIRADASRDAAATRTQNSNTGEAALSRAADKETADRYNTMMMPDASQDQLGEMGEIHRDARLMGASPPQAERVARGLSDHTLQMIRMTDGSYGVSKAGDKGAQPIAYLSKTLGDRLAGAAAPTAQPGPSPIGAGATTPYARGMGVSNNLTGTVMPQQQPAQSSALPVGSP